MGGAASRNKGCAFERLIAKAIIKAAGKGFTAKDCYRTPMSGGHPHAGESDLILSKALRKIFPFCVECKHYKVFQPKQLFKDNAIVKGWMTQVQTASSKDKFRRHPLLVFRGNNTDTYCASTLEGFESWGTRLNRNSVPGLLLVHKYKGKPCVWKVVVLNRLLKATTLARKLFSE
jgi:hypothetical protein